MQTCELVLRGEYFDFNILLGNVLSPIVLVQQILFPPPREVGSSHNGLPGPWSNFRGPRWRVWAVKKWKGPNFPRGGYKNSFGCGESQHLAIGKNICGRKSAPVDESSQNRRCHSKWRGGDLEGQSGREGKGDWGRGAQTRGSDKGTRIARIYNLSGAKVAGDGTEGLRR